MEVTQLLTYFKQQRFISMIAALLVVALLTLTGCENTKKEASVKNEPSSQSNASKANLIRLNMQWELQKLKGHQSVLSF